MLFSMNISFLLSHKIIPLPVDYKIEILKFHYLVSFLLTVLDNSSRIP